MSAYRCKQCGRQYETLPQICVCGNSDPAMWALAANDGGPAATPGGYYAPQANAYPSPAPQQPANNGWQQPMNNGWQQPQNGAPQQAPAAPQWQQPAYATPQPPAPQQQTGGGKKKNTALIAVILAVVLIGLGVGGYFLWQHFNGDSPSSSQDDDDKEKDGDKNKNKDAEKDDDGNEDSKKTDDTQARPDASGVATTNNVPTEANTETPIPTNRPTYTLCGVTVPIPDGFTLYNYNSEEDRHYKNSDESVEFAIIHTYTFDSHYDTIVNGVKAHYGSILKDLEDIHVFEISGHRAMYAFFIFKDITFDGTVYQIDPAYTMVIEIEEGAIIVDFTYRNRRSRPANSLESEIFNSVVVEQ